MNDMVTVNRPTVKQALHFMLTELDNISDNELVFGPDKEIISRRSVEKLIEELPEEVAEFRTERPRDSHLRLVDALVAEFDNLKRAKKEIIKDTKRYASEDRRGVKALMCDEEESNLAKLIRSAWSKALPQLNIDREIHQFNCSRLYNALRLVDATVFGRVETDFGGLKVPRWGDYSAGWFDPETVVYVAWHPMFKGKEIQDILGAADLFVSLHSPEDPDYWRRDDHIFNDELDQFIFENEDLLKDRTLLPKCTRFAKWFSTCNSSEGYMCPYALACLARDLDMGVGNLEGIDSRDLMTLARRLAADFTRRHSPEQEGYWHDKNIDHELDEYWEAAENRLAALGPQFMLEEFPYLHELYVLVLPTEEEYRGY
jgi:predicted metal-binding transcription factor (methanogenesis marker protein 9)